MSAIKKGTRARITIETFDHQFTVGDIVVSNGIDFPKHPRGQWSQFHTEGLEDETQYLLPHHYEVIKPAVVEELQTPQTPADELLPVKAVYAVVNATDDVLATTADRDYARELKAALGGKRKGIRIFQYGAVKEIR